MNLKCLISRMCIFRRWRIEVLRQLVLIWVIAGKDLTIEYRSRQAFLTTLFFALLILIIFNFAFDPGSLSTREASPAFSGWRCCFPV